MSRPNSSHAKSHYYSTGFSKRNPVNRAKSVSAEASTSHFLAFSCCGKASNDAYIRMFASTSLIGNPPLPQTQACHVYSQFHPGAMCWHGIPSSKCGGGGISGRRHPFGQVPCASPIDKICRYYSMQQSRRQGGFVTTKPTYKWSFCHRPAKLLT